MSSTTPLNIITNSADRVPVADGDYVTASCRVQGKDSRCRIRFEQGKGDSVSYSAESVLDMVTVKAELNGADKEQLDVRIRSDGEWLYYEVVYKVKEGQEYIGVNIQLSPPDGGGFISTSSLNLATPQIEKGTAASSFIATGGTPTTRASDMVTIPAQNNLFSLPFTVLCEAHKQWRKTPNAAPRVFDTFRHQENGGIIMGFGSSGGFDGFPYCDIGGSNRRINDNAALEKMIIGMRVKADLSTCCVSNGKLSSESKTTWHFIQSAATIRIGGQTTAGDRHLFGHIRNFRIWHKELNDRQLKEAV
ncbi:phage tail protein [Escherichia coli]|nr:phage tail protein [Escherichia coli]